MLQLDRHVPSPGVPEMNRRFGWLIGIVAAAFVILLGRLWQLQVVRGERYFQQSTNNFTAERFIAAVRGKITDRNRNVLVDNRPSFSVFVTPRAFTPELRAHLGRLLDLTSDEADDLAEKVARARDRARPVLVLEDVSRERLALLAQDAADLPGVEVRDAPHRNYLYGRLAAHVIGYMNQISDVELEQRRGEGYEEGDAIGRYGIEKQWENYLRGKRGVERFVVDAKGNRKEDASAQALLAGDVGPRFVPPVAGDDIVLTLDSGLQRTAEKALKDVPAGAVAVVEVGTGRILALVSKPSFEPNQMSGHLSRADEARMEADDLKPFLDRTLRQHYFPGSTFKFVTALAALEDGVVTPEDRVFCTGAHELGNRVFHCTEEHGSVALTQALAQSCDVYFWHLAEKIGIDRIAGMAQEFGFGAPTGLGLNGDVPGNVPWKAWYEGRGGYRIGYALNTAIGQGDVTVTVLQLALAYGALANGGDLWVPQIVARVETAAGRVVADYPPRLRRHIELGKAHLAAVARGMWGAVNEKKGTAFAARDALLSVAGKTGTAQVGRLNRQQGEGGWDPERDHAWFAGYAPAQEPKIAFVVLVEHGGHGGKVAAPVAMAIVRGYFGNAVAAELADLPGTLVDDEGQADVEPASRPAEREQP
jgi:penicillin-binding protein 2